MIEEDKNERINSGHPENILIKLPINENIVIYKVVLMVVKNRTKTQNRYAD